MERTGGLGPVVPRGAPAPAIDPDAFTPHPKKPGWSIDGRGRLRGPDMASDAAQHEAAVNRKNGVEPDHDYFY